MEADCVETHQLGRFDRSGGLELATNEAEEEENDWFRLRSGGGQGYERSGRTLATNGAEKDKPTKERVIDERSNKTMTGKVS